jgi:hypothetical protein
MTLAFAAAGNQGRHSAGIAEFTYRVAVTLDSDYATGGWATFAALLKAGIPALVDKTIISIQQGSFCDGYHIWWNRASDKLIAAVSANGTKDAECAASLNDLDAKVVELDIVCI